MVKTETRVKVVFTKAGEAYSATQAYRLHDYIVLNGVTIYACKKVDPATMTCVGHPLTDTAYWDKFMDIADFKAAAETATDSANAAAKAATDAAGAANTAKTNADRATEAANTAASAANTAKTNADTATTAANTAAAEAEKVNATITADNVLKVTDRTGVEKTLELMGQAEAATIKTELAGKFDKASIVQESGEAEDKVMSQKAMTAKLSDLFASITENSNQISSNAEELEYIKKSMGNEEINGKATSVRGLPQKIITSYFSKGKIYKLKVILSNIAQNDTSNDINVVLRNKDSESVAIFTNIKADTFLYYFCKESHDNIYVSAYNCTCDVELSVVEDNNALTFYTYKDSELAKDFASGLLKLYYLNILGGFKHLTFGVDKSRKNKYEAYLNDNYEYASITKDGYSIGFIKINMNNVQVGNPPFIEFPILHGLEILNCTNSNSNIVIPNDYILGELIQYPSNSQGQTCVTPEGKFKTSNIGGVQRLKVEKGKKYFIHGYYITSNYEVAVMGYFKDVLFNEPTGLVIQEANTYLNYSQVIEAKGEYLYIPDSIDVYSLTENIIKIDYELNEESNNAISNSAATRSINAIRESIVGINGKAAVLTIAASNAPDYAKNNANLVCTGENDEQVINNAISMLPSEGGEIHLSAGLFNVSSPIIIDRRIKIEGEGHSIGGIPKYTQTNGIDYEKNIWGLKYQNLYFNNGGGTIIRAISDCHVIQIGLVVPQKIQVILRDFSIQGFGKDRHTKCGIYGKSSTDISVIDNISVTECFIGCYLHGNSKNSWNDAIKIINSSFQWCAMGLVAYAYWGNLINCCIADNNGIVSYTDDDGNTTKLNCGGVFLGGGVWIASNNIIVRCVSYNISESTAGDAVIIKGYKTQFVNNMLSQNAGSMIRLESDLVRIENNMFQQWGKSNISGDMAAIKQHPDWCNMCVIGNNTFEYPENQLSEKDYVINLTNGKMHVIKNNTFVSIGQGFTRYIKAPDAIKSGNLAYGYTKENVFYKEILD